MPVLRNVKKHKPQELKRKDKQNLCIINIFLFESLQYNLQFLLLEFVAIILCAVKFGLINIKY